MKEVMVPRGERKLNALLSSAGEEDPLLRTADGREFLLTAVDDFDEEVARTRRNEKLMALLDERRKKGGALPWDHVKRELGVE